jgi:disease resistance protein RPM1
MEDAVVSAATGALGPVLGKLVALLGDEYKRLRNIHTEIKSLTRELEAIDAFLANMAEAEDPNPQDKAWMKEVRELSYDVEDNLDEFMARVVADKSFSKPDGFMDKIKNSLSLKRLKARHEIAKAIEDLKEQAIQVSQRNKRYRDHAISYTTARPSKIDRRALAIFQDVSKLVGVDGPKKELLQLLGDGHQQTKLVAIVGFGGLGKTTIANLVYKELKGKFQYRAFLSVSRNPDILSVMSEIYGQLNKEYSRRTEDLPTLLTEISDFLENKR